ncbi:unnamed protein product [Cylicostephanus goldi]|uniref:Uncharacterized protein n=1 Tax=Cylicostephanus goldi TaxID=71465 RepID=A0A3P7MMG7_CYLGO|nr:unnamed protein product [Cylicostephanus goldi]
MSPPIIRRSLSVNVLVKEGLLDEAIDEMEDCLQEEDAVFNSENSCISDEALDTLCNSIKEREDTQRQMQRFRTLQRVLTAYHRRSTKTLEELLHTPLYVDGVEESTEHEPAIDLSDKIIAQVPEFLSEEK